MTMDDQSKHSYTIFPFMLNEKKCWHSKQQFIFNRPFFNIYRVALQCTHVHNRRYNWMSWRLQQVIYFFYRTLFWMNSPSFEYKNRIANIWVELLPMGIQEIVTITLFYYINVVYQKHWHLFNINFSVIVCTIWIFFNELVFKWPMTR